MSIRAELAKNGRRIYLSTSRPVASLKMTIPGANLNKGRDDRPYWSLPLSMPVCRRLRETFGKELEIGPALWHWAKAEKAKAVAMKTLAAASDTDLLRVPTVAPRLAQAMATRTYQRVGARFVAEAHANGAGCGIFDQPGLGKTLEALGGIIESRTAGPYLVVAPKTSVGSVWEREIPRWLDGQTVLTLPEGDSRRVKQRDRRNAVLDELDYLPAGRLANTWVIVHPEAVRTRVWWVCGVCGQETPRKHGKVELRCKGDRGKILLHDPDRRKPDRVEHEYPQIFSREWGAVIADESDRSLLRLSGLPTQARQGMEMLRLRSPELRIAMTGTPTRGRPHLIWGQLNWIAPKAFPSFWNMVQMFWQVSSNGFSDYIIGDLIREEELWASLDRYVLRRTKAEVASDLPPKTYVGTPAVPKDEGSPIGVWMPMEGLQARAYQEMLETSAARLAGGSRVEAIGYLAELTRLKQFAGAYGRTEERIIREKCKQPKACPKGPEPHTHKKTINQFHPALPSNKFEQLVQDFDELGFPDSPTTKVVVASQFTETLELFAAELPARLQALSAHPKTPLKATMQPVLLTGKQTGRRRKAAIADMNAPVGTGVHIMFLQTVTGGVSITLDQVDHMFILDETYVPDDQEQLEDRIHRVSRPRPVFYHYYRSLDSVDLAIALTNAERDDANKRLMDGRRGVEYAKAMFKRTQEM